MAIDSGNTKLVVVPAGGLLGGNRVGLPASVLPARGVGLFVAAPGDLQRVEPVHVLPVAEVPSGAVAVGRDLADRLGLDDADRTPWRLRVADVPVVDAK